MDLDNARVDGLEIEQAGVALEMPAAPGVTPLLDSGGGFGLNLPVIKSASTASNADGVPPPLRYTVDERDVTADMRPLEKGGPKMTRPVSIGVIICRAEHAAAHAHSL